MSLVPIHQSICATCRLHSLLAAKQFARNRTAIPRALTRVRQHTFARQLHYTTSKLKKERTEIDHDKSLNLEPGELENYIHALDEKLELARRVEEDFELDDVQDPAAAPIFATPEEAALKARQKFGDSLPENYLDDEAYKVYERLYGPPIGIFSDDVVDFEENEVQGELDEIENVGTGLLREAKDGRLEEVEFIEEEDEEDMDEAEDEDVAEHTPDEDLVTAGLDAQTINDLAALRLDETRDTDGAPEPYDHTRAHPLTEINRFGTPSSTVQLPASAFVDPVSSLMSGVSSKHISEAAHRVFGGVGLPYSSSTPQRAVNMPQKAIPLNPSQGRMSEMDADVYMTTVMPGVYASVYSIMVETRKRLGGSWLEGLLNKEGGPRILDAGGAGTGVLAARQVMQAEWERMHDTSDDPDSFMAMAEAGGETGGESIAAPVGRATVLTSNEALRHRSSHLLENTTFLPRLPDYVHASDEQARERGKFDIIIAPHTLWPLKDDYVRKGYVENLWSMLSTDGGVLILLEKGVPRGFELVAAAREMLLNRHISSPGSQDMTEDLSELGEESAPEPDAGSMPEPDAVAGWGRPKEKGMIIAPCTNHTGCPMYVNRGISKGRKDYCHFSQRYIRPPFLQKILGAKHRNHEDVEFSYISIMRGRDLRDKDEEGVIQNDRATERAFAGFEDGNAATEQLEHEFDPTAPAVPDVDEVYGDKAPHSLSLPRAVLPPLKRHGHVIMDLCTPSGTLERWTVPKSFSKQAYRDARKSSWGDIWALGAKTRTMKNVRIGKGKEELGGVDSKKKKNKKAKNIIEVGYDSGGNIKEEDIKVKTGGRMRQGHIKGIRDKRDKSNTGRGRRKNMSDT